ncbi:MAG: hypothetical protein ACLR1G_16130 [Alistipes indistinctus]
MSLLQEIKEMLSTWRATAVLLLLLAAAMAAATFLEAGSARKQPGAWSTMPGGFSSCMDC